MLHLSTVESTTLELLKKLQQLPVLCNTRLVGGTALALQLGHRKSVDLDFFGQINVDSQDLKEALRTLGTLTILNDSKNIHIYVLNEVKIDIVNYTYPWLDDVVYKDGIRLASPRDIAAMKITAEPTLPAKEKARYSSPPISPPPRLSVPSVKSEGIFSSKYGEKRCVSADKHINNPRM